MKFAPEMFFFMSLKVEYPEQLNRTKSNLIIPLCVLCIEEG